MNKHTPSLWVISEYKDGRMAIICDSEGFDIAKVDYPNQAANSRLIAAAPDLLAALLMVLDDPDTLDGRPRTYECVRAAISKATGEE